MKLLILTTPVAIKILTIHDAPIESDAFDYLPFYDSWIETFVTKEKENADRDTI